MAFIMSLAVTALVVSPIFLLAGWFGQPQEARIRSSFNAVNGRNRY